MGSDVIAASLPNPERFGKLTPDEARAVLAATMGTFAQETLDQWVRWNPSTWIPAFDPQVRERLQRIAAPLSPYADRNHLQIARRDVFGCIDPIDRFIAAMAWGFGPTGYGAHRTAAIWRGGPDRIADLIEQFTRIGPGDPNATWLAWSRRPTKVAQLGTAFASKVAYFVAYDQGAAQGPLICDVNTSWAYWALTGCWDSRAHADHYGTYVRWCEQTAADIGEGCRSDDVERALFVLGPEVSRRWRSSKAVEAEA